MKKVLCLVLVLVSHYSYACFEERCKPWLVEGAFGMGFYSNVETTNEQNAFGRLNLGHGLFNQDYWQLFLVAGIQSGNTFRLNFSKEDIAILGGVPIEAELKPMLDVLIGVKSEALYDFPIYGWLKGGVVYRQLQVDRPSVNDIKAFSPEIQAGLGYQINEKASIHAGYQYIWGNKPTLAVDVGAETGVINNIPSQQAVMLGFAFNF